MDPSTGEVTEWVESRTWTVRGAQRRFVRVYPDGLSFVPGLRSLVTAKVFLSLLGGAGFWDGVSVLDRAGRRALCSSLGINSQQLSRALSELESLGVVSREGSRVRVSGSVASTGYQSQNGQSQPG